VDPKLWRRVVMLTILLVFQEGGKSRRLCHINMLKHYHSQSSSEEKPTVLTSVIKQ